MLSWVTASFMWLFVLVLIPYVMIGATSGFLLGRARGAYATPSALWCSVLGPVGWVLTLVLTRSLMTNDQIVDGASRAMDAVSDAVPANLADRLGVGGSSSDSDDSDDWDDW